MEQKPFMFMIKQTHKLWEEYLHKITADSGVPDTFRPIIMFLSHHPGASQKMIAKFHGITYAAVSQTVKEMTRADYLYKEFNGDDLRIGNLFLTDKGKDAYLRIHEQIQEADRKITNVIGEEKESEFIAALTTIKEALCRELH